MSDLSSGRDIDRGIGTQCLGTGAGAAEAKREQGSPESGSRAVRPRLGLVIDGWARGETGETVFTRCDSPFDHFGS